MLTKTMLPTSASKLVTQLEKGGFTQTWGEQFEYGIHASDGHVKSRKEAIMVALASPSTNVGVVLRYERGIGCDKWVFSGAVVQWATGRYPTKAVSRVLPLTKMVALAQLAGKDVREMIETNFERRESFVVENATVGQTRRNGGILTTRTKTTTITIKKDGTRSEKVSDDFKDGDEIIGSFYDVADYDSQPSPPQQSALFQYLADSNRGRKERNGR